jgi:hypothetical protein
MEQSVQATSQESGIIPCMINILLNRICEKQSETCMPKSYTIIYVMEFDEKLLQQ